MNTEKIIKTLKNLYDKNQIIMWYDTEGVFKEKLDELNALECNVYNLNETTPFGLKIELQETLKTDQKIFIYSNSAKPEPKFDLLYDVSTYSCEFKPDQANMIFNELGLAQGTMVDHIRNRLTFFKSQKRFDDLKKIIKETDDAYKIDRKMIAIIFRADTTQLNNIILKLFKYYDEQNHEPKQWQEIVTMSLEDSFWLSCKKDFGYHRQNPDLGDFLVYLMASEFMQNLQEIPLRLKDYVTTDSQFINNITVFLTQWRGMSDYHDNYKNISKKIEEQVEILSVLSQMNVLRFDRICTFSNLEKEIVKKVIGLLTEKTEASLKTAHEIINNRLESYWAKQDERFKHAYYALKFAKKLFVKHLEHCDGFKFETPVQMFNAYTTEIYKFDQYYRKFYFNLDTSNQHSLLKPITESVESLYAEWYMTELINTWNVFVEKQLLSEWQIKGIPNQYKFFNHFIAPLLKDKKTRRVAVIISDALRYEVADEILKTINDKNNRTAQMNTMLGVLPSYTTLGMAALLPHETMTYKQGEDIIVADDISTGGKDNRSKILNRSNGIALSWHDDLKNITRDQARDLVKDTDVVYIYHNEIDSTGDKAATEHKTFDAVSSTIREIDVITSKALDTLNCGTVFVTADHGFLYRVGDIEKSEVSRIDVERYNPYKAKKRYVIGKGLPDDLKEAWHGYTKITAHTSDETEFLIPKGPNKFHLKGGAKFIHGGAFLQEICIPVIQCKRIREDSQSPVKARKVEINVLTGNSVVKEPRYKVTLLQTELLSEKILPRRVNVFFGDKDKNKITNEVSFTFDAETDNDPSYKQVAEFTFSNIDTQQNKDFYLWVLDASDDRQVIQPMRYTINIYFQDEFGD